MALPEGPFGFLVPGAGAVQAPSHNLLRMTTEIIDLPTRTTKLILVLVVG